VLSSALFKQPTFLRHLHEQAKIMQVPTNQPITPLRSQIRDALKSRLSSFGWGTDGEPLQLRERLRQAELMDEAKKLGFDITQPLPEIKTKVFQYYKTKLQDEGASPRGSLRAMKERLDRRLQIKALGPEAFMKKKAVVAAPAKKKKGGAAKGAAAKKGAKSK